MAPPKATTKYDRRAIYAEFARAWIVDRLRFLRTLDLVSLGSQLDRGLQAGAALSVRSWPANLNNYRVRELSERGVQDDEFDPFVINEHLTPATAERLDSALAMLATRISRTETLGLILGLNLAALDFRRAREGYDSVLRAIQPMSLVNMEPDDRESHLSQPIVSLGTTTSTVQSRRQLSVPAHNCSNGVQIWRNSAWKWRSNIPWRFTAWCARP